MISKDHFKDVEELKETLGGTTTKMLHVGHAPLYKCPPFVPNVGQLL